MVLVSFSLFTIQNFSFSVWSRGVAQGEGLGRGACFEDDGLCGTEDQHRATDVSTVHQQTTPLHLWPGSPAHHSGNTFDVQPNWHRCEKQQHGGCHFRACGIVMLGFHFCQMSQAGRSWMPPETHKDSHQVQPTFSCSSSRFSTRVGKHMQLDPVGVQQRSITWQLQMDHKKHHKRSCWEKTTWDHIS